MWLCLLTSVTCCAASFCMNWTFQRNPTEANYNSPVDFVWTRFNVHKINKQHKLVFVLAWSAQDVSIFWHEYTHGGVYATHECVIDIALFETMPDIDQQALLRFVDVTNVVWISHCCISPQILVKWAQMSLVPDCIAVTENGWILSFKFQKAVQDIVKVWWKYSMGFISNFMKNAANIL